ncbi:MAG: hypothetical protein ACLFP4_08810 [Spirochaetales bacterium]
MRHPRLQEFEACLRRLFATIDAHLEDKYGNNYRLHPARPARGTTSRAESDGLFNIGATFTPGYGSEIGRGYVVQVDMVTLDKVPEEVREKIEQEVADLVNEKLPYYFPDRDLSVDRDRNVYKIHGDLRLGET